MMEGLTHDRGHDKRATQGHAKATDLFGCRNFSNPGHLPSAPFLRKADAPQVKRCKLFYKLFSGINNLILVHFSQKIACYFLADKLFHFISKGSLIRCEQKIIHGAPPFLFTVNEDSNHLSFLKSLLVGSPSAIICFKTCFSERPGK